MGDDLERVNRLLDDLAAERDPRDRPLLSASEADLAETAAFLKAASVERSAPDEGFVERLGAQLAAARASDEHPPAAGAVDGSGLSRRGLLGRIAGAVAGFAVGAGAGEALRGHTDQAAAATAYQRGHDDGYWQGLVERFRTPMVPKDRGAWLDTGHNVAGVVPGQAVRFRAGAIEGFLVNPGHGRPIYALSAACTHMGCLISWLDKTDTFLCPCHGAQYRADGTVLSGIARHPLPPLRVRVHHDGGLYVWAVGEHPPVTTLAPYT